MHCECYFSNIFKIIKFSKCTKPRIKFLYIFCKGGPGSGRGTQCEKLALKHKLKHLSSGDLLRHEVMSGSQRGGNLYKLMSSGEVVPNGIVNDLIAEAMVKAATGADVRHL